MIRVGKGINWSPEHSSKKGKRFLVKRVFLRVGVAIIKWYVRRGLVRFCVKYRLENTKLCTSIFMFSTN